jgi:hypothetical protein
MDRFGVADERPEITFFQYLSEIYLDAGLKLPDVIAGYCGCRYGHRNCHPLISRRA